MNDPEGVLREAPKGVVFCLRLSLGLNAVLTLPLGFCHMLAFDFCKDEETGAEDHGDGNHVETGNDADGIIQITV